MKKKVNLQILKQEAKSPIAIFYDVITRELTVGVTDKAAAVWIKV